MRSIPDDNLSYPILLTWDTNESGSGFYFNNNDKYLYIVTARHVLFINKKIKKEDPDNFVLISNKLTITSYSRDISIVKPIISEIVFSELSKENIKFSPDNDVAIIKIAKLIYTPGILGRKINFEKGYNILDKPDGDQGLVGVPQEYFKIFEKVLIANDVIIFGYPSSLGNGTEIEYGKPLLRKGIVAGKNFKNRTIIIDCPSYQGNSGGLVIEIGPDRKTEAIGIISGFIPFIEITESLHFKYRNSSIENSGYSIVVPIDTILSLI